MLCLATVSYGQELSRLSNNSINLDEKSFIQSNGFPFTQYQFNNSQINAQLKAGLDQRNLGKKLATYGWIAEGMEAVVMLLPSGEGSLNDPNPGAGKTLLGTGIILGGITSIVIGSIKKRKAIKKIQNASYQYSAINKNLSLIHI